MQHALIAIALSTTVMAHVEHLMYRMLHQQEHYVGITLSAKLLVRSARSLLPHLGASLARFMQH